MSEKELGNALLELDAHRLAGVGDGREQTWKILERDRNRVWWWTAITFTLWGCALFMVVLMMIHYALIFPLQAELHSEEALARAGMKPPELHERGSAEAKDIDKEESKFARLTPEQREAAKFKAQIMFQMATVGVTFSVGLTCLAVLASVLLSRASRRATLRQINASLLEISQQLKELRTTSAPSAKGP